VIFGISTIFICLVTFKPNLKFIISDHDRTAHFAHIFFNLTIYFKNILQCVLN
jgi:hypothetical protein